jgi:hypothetical protein
MALDVAADEGTEWEHLKPGLAGFAQGLAGEHGDEAVTLEAVLDHRGRTYAAVDALRRYSPNPSPSGLLRQSG